MIADARSLEDGFEFDCDLCIVGTGAAGLTLARFLNHSKISICLVESGGMTPEKETQDLYRGESTGNVTSLSPDYLHGSRLRVSLPKSERTPLADGRRDSSSSQPTPLDGQGLSV